MKRRNVIKKDVLENYISQGHTDTEIAELVGVTQPAIYAARKRFGLEREVKNAKKRKYDIDLIADLAEKGYTRDEIMLLTGISKASLLNYSKAYDIKIKSARKMFEEEVVRMLKEKMTVREIINEVNVSESYVRCLKKEILKQKA